jgi:EAL domain-containing protein (putative c-di-GMP-specific phosphodiesterase class I)
VARAFRLKVVAEGVETAQQYALLKDLGCDACQGFLLSRPLPATALETLLRGEQSACHRRPTRLALAG